MPIKVKIDGAWQTATAKVKVAGTWKACPFLDQGQWDVAKGRS